MRTRSPVLQQRKPAAYRSFRRCIEDRWRARRARLTAVADARQVVNARFDQRRRRTHVHHFGRAGIADRPGAAHEQQRAFVDAERWIVDARVIVLGSVEHDGASFERLRILRIGEIARRGTRPRSRWSS